MPLHQAGICLSCRSNPPPYASLRSWAEFSGPLRKALHTLKYKNNLGLASQFCEDLGDLVKNNHWDFDLILPVPISSSHMKDRGFNQAEIIARPLALLLNIPFSNKSVVRIKETKSQVKLTAEERFKNLQGAFAGNSAKLKNKKVLLVDDIVTTGATMISCTKALLDAGCREVFCLTVAQTPKNAKRLLQADSSNSISFSRGGNNGSKS